MDVAIADDSTLFRRGLAALLTTAGVHVVAEARDGDTFLAALDALAAEPPDLAILDIRMPPGFSDEGLVLAGEVRARHPSVGILLLSTYPQADYAARLLLIGTHGVGYLLKDRVDDVATLTDALDRAVRGESVVDPEIVTRLLTRHTHTTVLAALTEREREVLRHMAEGRSNAGISRELNLSAKTVEAHAASVFNKLGLNVDSLSNRRVLAVMAWLRATTSLTL